MKHKKRLYYSTILILLVLIGSFLYFKPAIKTMVVNEFRDRSYEKLVGVYDEKKEVPSDVIDNVKHISVKWKSFALSSNKKALQNAIVENKNVLITIETWPSFNAESTSVLDEVLKGSYDKEIKALANVVNLSKGSVFVRWNPEMEVPVKQYPWQYQSPSTYIDAFNYFSGHLKKNAPKVKIVWAPTGYPGDSEFWPGKNNVDLISIVLGSGGEKLSNIYPSDLSDLDNLRFKLHRLRFMDKPVFILSADGMGNVKKTDSILKKIEVERSLYKNTIYSTENLKEPFVNTQIRKNLVLGVFDPMKKLIDEPEIGVEHIFVDWGEIQQGEFVKKFNEVIARKHDVILTMEPWKSSSNIEDPNVLQSTLSGKYDKEISKLYSVISSVKQTVYLRWAHEMEIPIHRYSWQSQDPVVYISSFRYFMNFLKEKPKNIQRVWGPAGDRGSADWYPGNDVVDYISIAIYGLPDKNITDENMQEAFSNIFQRKSYRMRFFNKPIFITEFGVKGSEKYQDKWLIDAAKTIQNNKQIFGVCYFNLYDNPKAWGHIKAPDWSISKNSLKKFSSELKQSFTLK
ncbi:glycoside hydrolase family 26 protein [Pedobacter sp. V48]|uniref:glycoside hydrolase family 26 protein n=1 Tax=Pedobacter sp. V48 TaxID=509635 RepID=UPI0003E51087|nr:hypothetical protein [Pedobacter sp. V48]ETZ21206.1 hypothetical protein N824_03540 [Pedobacter sp. V48]